MPDDKSAFLFIELVNEHMGANKNVRQMLNYLSKFPEVYCIYCAELDSALSLFSKYQHFTNEFPGDVNILVNAQMLQKILNGKNLLTRSELEYAISNWRGEIKLWHSIFSELTDFDFVNQDNSIDKFSGAFFIALYRTFVLNKYPIIRKEKGQVASSLEEMLAILALAGCQTQLYLSTRHWLLDYKSEGFSPLLSQQLASITYDK